MIKSLITFLLLVFVFGVQVSSAKKTPVRIIFDTDMGSDCDDVGALALLNVYADVGKAEILVCIYSSGKVPYGVGVIDAINTYFGRGNIPIGADYETNIGDLKDKMNAGVLAKNTELFGHDLIQNSDAVEQTKLTRKILAEQDDNSVTYLTVGHTNGLYELLISEPDEISPLSGIELVEKKVIRWIAMGALDANNKEGRYTQDWNLFRNGTAASTEYVMKNFPKAACFIATGSDIMTGKSLLKTPENNIVRRAYEEWLFNTQKKTLDDQRPSWDIIAVYYAIEGLGDFLESEETGWLDFDVKKGANWRPEQSLKQHSFITTKQDKKQQFADYLNFMISSQPKK